MVTVEQIAGTETFKKMNGVKQVIIQRAVNRKKIEHAFNVLKNTGALPTGLDASTISIVTELIQSATENEHN